jgi:hypothetical protein
VRLSTKRGHPQSSSVPLARQRIYRSYVLRF